MAENDVRIVTTDATPRGIPTWLKILGVILLIVGIIALMLAFVNRMNVRTERLIRQAIAESRAEQSVSDQKSEYVEQSVPVQKDNTLMIGSKSEPGEDTYFPELSCSHLSSCTTTEVPEGYFTIGFTRTATGCDWKLFNAGETINYDGLDEFHTYNNYLPLTRLEGFVKAQTPWVFACQIH